MHRGPAVESIADKCRNALFACNADQAWHKAVIAFAMDRGREAHHRGAESACRRRKRRLLRLAGEARIVRILFCCERRERALALNEQGAGSDDQRTIRARESAAERLDGTPIRL